MEALRDVAPYLDLGWRLAGAAAFPPIIGYAVDAWLGTLPWGVLIGAALGLASALVQLRRLQRELDR
jgi:F0F1-type ATP synthase assembly protein I